MLNCWMIFFILSNTSEWRQKGEWEKGLKIKTMSTMMKIIKIKKSLIIVNVSILIIPDIKGVNKS